MSPTDFMQLPPAVRTLAVVMLWPAIWAKKQNTSTVTTGVLLHFFGRVAGIRAAGELADGAHGHPRVTKR